MGCFLIVTKKDFQQLSDSRQRVLAERRESYQRAGFNDAEIKTLKRRVDGLSPDDTHKFAEVLADPRLTDTSTQEALAKGLANPVLDDKMALTIPAALAEVFHNHPEAAGFFTRMQERGPGARAWVGGLKHGQRPQANAAAYELLATRRLMYVAADDLKIDSTDKLHYGIKQQAHYNHTELRHRELLGALVKLAPERWQKYQRDPEALERETAESDILIGRPVAGMIHDDIFVDFKHTIGTTGTFRDGELVGIAVALATGEIAEAHIVCNAGLSTSVRQRIEDINNVMSDWGTGQVKAHQRYSW